MVIPEARINRIFSEIAGKKIAVIGDVMLDQYYWGNVGRISPEAPVPVVEVTEESVRLGGAANVANNVASLGAEPLLFGVVGGDDNGDLLRSLANDAGFWTDGIINDSARPTTIKTRVIAHNQHVVRFDRETTSPIDLEISSQLYNLLKQKVENLDAIILQDYNKGVFTEKLIQKVIALGNEYSVPVTVDPKFLNFFSYKNVTIFKPNRREIEQAFGVHLKDDSDFERYGTEIINRLNAENVLMTRGERGMMLIEKNAEITHIPTRTRSVADVSGAGDTVIASLSVMVTTGASVKEAAMIANFAAGIVCEQVGIVPIDRRQLIETLMASDRKETSVHVQPNTVRNG